MYLLLIGSCRLEIVIWKNTEDRGQFNASILTCQISSDTIIFFIQGSFGNVTLP